MSDIYFNLNKRDRNRKIDQLVGRMLGLFLLLTVIGWIGYFVPDYILKYIWKGSTEVAFILAVLAGLLFCLMGIIVFVVMIVKLIIHGKID